MSVDVLTFARFKLRMMQKYPDAVIGIQNWGDFLRIETLRLHPTNQGKGRGSAIMRDVNKFADAHDLRVGVTPDPVYGGNMQRLRRFYPRFGYVRNRGRHHDPEISDSYVREPARKL